MRIFLISVYRAEVQGYCEDTGIVTLRYVSEPHETYEEELHQKKIKLLKLLI